MATSFESIYQKFIFKIEGYKLLEVESVNREAVLKIYLDAACSKFYKKCRNDLSARNIEDTEFTASLEWDEIDILTELMVTEWLQPKVYSDELLESRLNTRDFTEYSPAKLIEQVRAVYEMSKKNARQMIIDYTFSHGDVGEMNRD